MLPYRWPAAARIPGDPDRAAAPDPDRHRRHREPDTAAAAAAAVMATADPLWLLHPAFPDHHLVAGAVVTAPRAILTGVPNQGAHHCRLKKMSTSVLTWPTCRGESNGRGSLQK